MKIFLFGYYGWKNAGDDAMLLALLQELDLAYPDATFSVLSPSHMALPPHLLNKLTYVYPSILALAIGIWRSSIFAIGGGTHLFDYGFKFKSLRIQLQILALVFYSRILCKKVWILGNGLGPLETSYSNFICKLICQIAEFISVRDKVSFKYLETWGFSNKSCLAFDPAVLLNPRQEQRLDSESYKDIIGISITPVHKIYYGQSEHDAVFTKKLAISLNKWLSDDLNRELHLFVFHGASKDDDVQITLELKNSLVYKHRVRLITYDGDPMDFLNNINRCNGFIGMKYHSCVFAYICRIPLLVIDYHPKCRIFAEGILLPNGLIVSMKELTSNKFDLYFDNLLTYAGSPISLYPLSEARHAAKKNIPYNCNQ